MDTYVSLSTSWTPPLHVRIKIKVNTRVGHQNSTVGAVAQDDLCKIVVIATKSCPYTKAEVEVFAYRVDINLVSKLNSLNADIKGDAALVVEWLTKVHSTTLEDIESSLSVENNSVKHQGLIVPNVPRRHNVPVHMIVSNAHQNKLMDIWFSSFFSSISASLLEGICIGTNDYCMQ